MSTEEKKKKKTYQPTIWYLTTDFHPGYAYSHFEFFKEYGAEEEKPAWSNFVIPSLGVYRAEPHYEPDSAIAIAEDVRYIAAHRDGEWAVTRAYHEIQGTKLIIHAWGQDERQIDKMAWPVDPRMTRKDIDGAKHIIKNSTNTGWLFSPATPQDHEDRLLITEATITTVFEELLRSRFSRVDIVRLAGSSTSNQRGELTVAEHINSFKNDCAKIARYNEHQLYIGQHIHEYEKHTIYAMCHKAFMDTKQKWRVEKSAELRQISNHLTPIEKRLSKRPTFEYRWEKPTIFPDAERDE